MPVVNRIRNFVLNAEYHALNVDRQFCIGGDLVKGMELPSSLLDLRRGCLAIDSCRQIIFDGSQQCVGGRRRRRKSTHVGGDSRYHEISERPDDQQNQQRRTGRRRDCRDEQGESQHQPDVPEIERA